MRVATGLCLLGLLACGRDATAPGPSPAQAVGFRVLSERQNAGYCVQPPSFGVAVDEARWVDLYARQTDCRPDVEVRLPRIDFDAEIAIAGWWKVEPCLGYSIATQSVARDGDVLVVRARSTGPSPGHACATALGALESFLAVERFDGLREVRFVLDGTEAGRVAAP